MIEPEKCLNWSPRERVRHDDRQTATVLTIQLSDRQDEHQRIVHRWTLSGARIIKHTGPPLNAKGTEVAIEELVLSGERIKLKRG